MSETKIKICGLTGIEDIGYVNEVLPDYIGFVFAQSRRQIARETACRLKSSLDSRISAVGVFVNEPVDAVIELCKAGIIDLIQLHGDEDQEYISKINKAVNNPVIKAVRVKDTASLNGALHITCDFLLLDAYSDKALGGTGETFDWKLLKNINRPFFLAGGINISNAKPAMEAVKPYCLDVSSGVETNGIKDRDKIIQLVNEIRRVK
jgi:phosphoribosylanthranilate isomerase